MIVLRTRGETDITIVFGTIIASSILAGCTTCLYKDKYPSFIHFKKALKIRFMGISL